jgi:hypothetical protein
MPAIPPVTTPISGSQPSASASGAGLNPAGRIVK